ncbi:putative PKS-NRPS protein [Xylaria palmicola]|nr:putative PKS-NRPS protein [Xylaria palmicola]
MPFEPIAIVGSGCRLPGGANTPSKLWDVLKDPSDLRQEIPKDRFNVDRYYHSDNSHHGTSNIRHSYVLEDDYRNFDANFFGVKAVEASAMDPQQRLLLETVYESLESAGMPMDGLRGSQTGVFVGNMSVDYTEILSQDVDSFPTYFAPGTARSILSNRISYFFDWHGPSVSMDTACSSSLVALHQAVQSLRAGEIPLAVVAGANLLLGPAQYIAESKLKMLSPNGRSRMWDEGADGYARGEGFVSVVLKKLSDAIRDGSQIECIIRETGTNHDGKTKGITMPSPIAQAALIRETYQRAGLDLSVPADRPQYFEAHGTGTPAGDPVEAEAISTAFYGPGSGFKRGFEDPKLLVGSVKTVIGHTEGTAGLASVLKVSLALQNNQVPPNLHLNRLSATVKPHYKDLEIPTSLRQWPEAPGSVKRASVNSFGFGGANAHAILEAYTPEMAKDVAPVPSATLFSPFVLSAASEKTLAANVAAHAAYLEASPDANLHDVSFTLYNHRSTLQKRAIFAASSRDALLEKLRNYDASKSAEGKVVRTLPEKPKVLGIFTGQGAQWPRMGAELIESSAAVRAIVAALEKSLAELPPSDRPSWSLTEEMLAPAGKSQIQKAELSQPLCTALQIILVDILRQSGITFSAVVGHSSGEIGAAYAAGVLTASEAIRIAYYRGFHTHRCQGPTGQKGAMMAVGTSYEDAQELCSLDDFEGRLCVAASNSTSSVTISGDADAIEELAVVMEEENKFHRALQVDKAYHSHHMIPCLDPYIASLKACGISPKVENDSGCAWVSSVHPGDIADVDDDLRSVYWANNMGQPVLFSQACEIAVREQGPFDQVIEVGPHPALKGPTSQVIEDTIKEKVPFANTLARKRSALDALAECVGSLWETNGPVAIDFEEYDALLSGSKSRQLLKDLPFYQWDHETPHFHDSRIIKAARTATMVTNELLGSRILDSSQSEARWRNRLNSSEVPWLKHHQVQNQVVFPAAGYISCGVEAVRELLAGMPVSVIELRDFVVGQALLVPDRVGVETVASLTNITRSADKITARYTFIAEDVRSGSFDLHEKASANVVVYLGEASSDALPPRPEAESLMIDVHEDRFYDAVGGLGFGYTGPFKALNRLQRKMDLAHGYIAHPEPTPGFDRLLVHPAPLDAAIQSIILAYCFPGDTRLRTIHLPTGIDTIRFNVPLCESAPLTDTPFKSSVPTGGIELSDINGDSDIYLEDGTTLVQLQGLHTTPLVPPTPDSDLSLFTAFQWGPLLPRGQRLALEGADAVTERALFEDLERVAYYYLRTLDLAIAPEQRTNLPAHQVALFNYIDNMLSRVKSGSLSHVQKEWDNDSHDDVMRLVARHRDSIDLELMCAVGENLPAVVRGEMNMLEPMVEGNKLNRFYVDALGMPRYTEELARIVAQISHRYPHMHILEVGAGTGGATKILLKHLAGQFNSYTYTDISSGFFETAREVFSATPRMTFKTLDIEKDYDGQGYTEHTYDVVVANLVVHATKNLETTMTNLRRLIKPGGYLILLEITDNDPLRFGFLFGGLPGWWLGQDDDRKLSPCIDIAGWDAVMRKTGFSGVDTVTPHVSTCPLSVILTQAVDDQFTLIREPLSAQPSAAISDNLTILGASSGLTADITEAVRSKVSPFFKNVRVATDLNELLTHELPLMGTVLSLVELDAPIFKDMTAERLRAFQHIFKQSKNIMWVTVGAKSSNPWSAMIIGIARNVVLEMSHLRFQLIDFDTETAVESGIISDALLSHEYIGNFEASGQAGDFLHTTEPVLYHEDGYLQMARLKLNKERNMRYNASRRPVYQDVDPKVSPLELTVTDSGSHTLQQLSSPPVAETRRDVVKIQMEKSLSRSVKLPSSDFLFVVSGTDESGRSVVALSDIQSSVIDVDSAWTIPVGGNGSVVSTVLALHDALIAQTLVDGLESSTCLVVLDASPSLTKVLKRAGSRRNIKIASLTSSKTKVAGAISIHPNDSSRSIGNKLRALGARVSRFANLSNSQSTSQAVASVLPVYCDVQDWDTLTRSTAFVTERTNLGLDCDVPSLLKAAWAYVKSDRVTNDATAISPLDLKSLSSSKSSDVSLVDWTEYPLLPVQLQTLSSTIAFSDDKTYWLVGLTGGLGLSLCNWMIDHGARYLVITSRNPKVDAKWLANAESRGAIVKVFSNDVTNQEAVHKAHNMISESMPPMGGVIQGAMVLNDAMFAEMTMPIMEKVIKPKVNGSIYLEEIFRDTPLEFFLYLSSVAAITGNKGQSMYAAANMFMNTLAAQRRKRGAVASVVNIGAIMGNGYITRELNAKQQVTLQEVGNVWLSEQDFLNIIAEGVHASQLDRNETMETTTGLRLTAPDSKVSWASNPMFQHLVLYNEEPSGAGLQKSGSVPLKTQLEGVTSEDGVSQVLGNAFSLKIKSILQIPESREILETSLDELGMDSLIAVEIRSWFLKELGVDVPVLEILNGGSPETLLRNIRSLVITSMGLTFEGGNSSAAAAPVAAESQIPEAPAISTPADVTPAENPKLVLPIITTDDISDNGDSISEGTGSSERLSTMVPTPDSPVSEAAKSGPESAIPDMPQDVIERSIPVSFGQSRFWFLKHFLANQSAFNVTTVVRMQGNLHVDQLAKAFSTVTNHHEALRTAFVSTNNQPMQIVLKKSNLALERRAITSSDEVTEAYKTLQSHVYNLESGQTMRMQLLTLSPTTHFLILGYHHINMDGLSFEVLFNDIQKAYEGTPFTPGVIQYPDFTIREHHEYRTGAWKSHMDFWKKEFATLPEPLPLLPIATQITRPSSIEYGTTRVERRIPAQLSAAIKQVSRKFKGSVFAFYLALLKALIVRHVSVDQVCIGMADANRRQSEVIESVGLYLNLVPLLVENDPAQPFGESVSEMHHKSQSALANAKVPFDVLLNELGVARSSSHTPLFQVFLNYRQGVREVREFCDCECEGELLGGGELAYDISFDIVENPGGETNVMLSVQKALYNEAGAQVLIDSFFNLMESFASNPAMRLNKPALYQKTAIEEAIDLGTGAEYQHAWPATIPQRVEELIKENPEKLALTDGQNVNVSYGQMGAIANGISAALAKYPAGAIVGVMQRPSPGVVSSILGIMKSGRVVVPLDPRVGTARLSAIAAESKPVCILVDDSTQAEVKNISTNATLINIARIPAVRSSSAVASKPNELAALIYTSGSTGTPKGISLSHASLRTNIEVISQRFGLTKGKDVVLQQTALSFDMSLFQMFTGLCNHGTVVVAPENVRGDARALANLMLKTGVTFTAATPTEYNSLIRHGSSDLKQNSKWRVACSGGEKATSVLADNFRSLGLKDLQLIDAYGPAEISFACSTTIVPYHLEASKRPVTGFNPLSNYAFYILGENDGKPVPAGVPGEVYIAGGGVGLGYLNNTELTARQFLANPYASKNFKAQGWTTMHRTGDRGRLLADGGLILEGRIGGDSQVKLRGIRIDLEEVEHRLVKDSQGLIADAAVSMRTDNASGTDFLVAHVILKNPEAGDEEIARVQELQRHLQLPQYMRPSTIVPVAALPMNSSHKLDRQALRTLAIPVSDNTDETNDDLTPLQQQVKRLWAKIIPGTVLAQRPITVETDFFHVGGTSLMLVELQSLFKKELACTPSVQQLFQSSTLGGMVTIIEGAAEEAAQSLDWETEAALLEGNSYKRQSGAGAPVASPPKTVVLTGATGFLGRHILEQLLRHSSVQKIFAVAVRREHANLPKTLLNDSRVEILRGDLGSADLGLSEWDAARVFGAADGIIHNGADVSFMKTYGSLRRTNVQATKNLAALAVRLGRGGTPFHFVSSASVTQLTPLEEIGEVSVAAYPPPSSGPVDGYTAAKWVSERHLELVAAAHGLPVTVHRPASITGNESSELDLMGNLFKFVERLEAVPDSPAWKGYFDLISVHTVAGIIARSVVVVPAGQARGSGVRYQYEAGEIVYPLSTMKDMMQLSSNFPVRVLGLGDWVDEAESKGLNPMLAAYLRGTVGENTRLAFPKLIKGSS